MSLELSAYENFGLGVYAAVIEGLLLQPTVYWKNARAWKLPFTLNLRVIYRGTVASLCNEMNMLGMQFGLTAFFQKTFISGASANKVAVGANHQLYSACCGGIVSSLFTSPFELLMIQQQRESGSIVGTFKNVVKQYGYLNKGLFRGLAPSVCRDSIFVAGLLGVPPVVHDQLTSMYNFSNSQASVLASMIGGFIAAIPSHPFDIAKTCMAGYLRGLVYTNLSNTMRLLYSDAGFSRLFHGGVWRTINIVGTVYIVNEIRIRFPKYLK